MARSGEQKLNLILGGDVVSAEQCTWSSGAGAGMASSGVRVLLVEDEALIAMFAEDALAGAGYAVVGSARTVAEAVQMAVALKPDLIVMDVRLASMGRQVPDGVVAAVEIFRTTGIRSLFATAQIDDETKGRAAEAQPYGWLVKPYAAADLLRIVDAIAASLPNRNGGQRPNSPPSTGTGGTV